LADRSSAHSDANVGNGESEKLRTALPAWGVTVRQKISGYFRTAAGAENFATLRTVLSTARKQGWSLIETLQESPGALIAKLRTA
jgi:hypothetical protein